MLHYKHHVSAEHLLTNCKKLYPTQFAKLSSSMNPFKRVDPVSILGAIGMAMWCSDIEQELKREAIERCGEELFNQVKEDIQIALAVIGTKFCFPEEQK